MNLRDVPNLDFVRSVAVLSVVMEHTLLAMGIQRVGPFPIPYLGVVGVMVFFVLTALVLMASLERKPHTLDFYIRRFFRIYPLAWAAILAARLFHAPVGPAVHGYFTYMPPTLKATLSEMTLLPSVPLSAVGVMWSLPYEVGMYLLLPMIFFFVRKNFSLWPLVVLWSLTLFVLRKSPADTHNFAVAIPYFLPGIMAWVGFSRWRPRLPGWLLPFALIGLWLITLPRMNFHAGWIFCLLVGLGLPLFRQMTSPLVLVPSRLIARYSYGIYLTHPFAIVIGIRLLAGHALWLRVLGELLPILLVPVLAYHALELPMIRLGSRLAQRAEHTLEQHEKAELGNLPAS